MLLVHTDECNNVRVVGVRVRVQDTLRRFSAIMRRTHDLRLRLKF